MDPDRWRKIDRLFHEAVQQPPAQRVAFLDQACNGDFELRLELEALLACDRSSVGVTNLPAAVVAVNISTDHGRADPFARDTLPGAVTNARAADMQPGEMVSHYRINGQLGRGGMGVVYHATDSRLERDVALKFLPEDYLRDPQRLQRFQREARMASALNHPHICTVHDWHEADGRSFIVMELVQGRTLRAVAAERPPLHVLLRLCGQVARALAAAHAAGIVHRDVKPDNIMVRPDGYVKVVDFGLARRGPSAEELLAAGSVHGSQESYSEESVTKTGSLLGTVRYMSPEQARGEPCGSAGDVFALGIVLYELLCGVNPFARATELETLTAILNDAPLPPASLAPDIPVPLARLIEELLAKDPLRRPTAADGAAVLAELCGDDAGSITDGLLAAQRNRCTVGRQRERAELWKAFEGAAAGKGMVLTVAGEPGLGKTTLAEDFLGELAAQPCAIARGRCSERLAGTEAFLPILELLDSMLQGARAEAAERLLQRVAPTWHAQVVSAAALPPGAAESAPRATSQERMKREFVAFIQEMAQLRPLVLFIDDMHWADISTVDLLAYVGGKLAGLRVLLLLTFRPTELQLNDHPLLPVKLELQARNLSREVSLDFLTLDDITRYLELQFAENTFPSELSAILHHRTEGNPLFMVDVVRYLRDRGVLAVQDGRWSLVQSLPDLERDLPESTRSMIQRKIEQLGDDDRRLLVAASVQGYIFDSAVVAVCLDRDAAEVEERLERLERVHAFVRQIEECELPDGALTLRYSFVHVLYQNALHGTLRPTRKASLSRAVAEALVSFHGDQRSNIANELAVLFEAARDFPLATEQYHVAAQNALKVFAYREAVLLAERGLELLQRLSFPSERLPLALGIQLIQASALVASQGYAADATREAWRKARQFAAQVGDRHLLFAASFGLAVNHMVANELFQSRECCGQLIDMALQLQEPMLEMGACTVSGYTLEFLGEVVAAHESFERARSLHDPQQNPAYVAYYGYDPGGAAWVETSRTLAVLGYLEQARLRVEESIAWAQQTGHPLVISHAYHVSVHPYFFRGEPRRIIELAEAGLAHCDEHGIANDRGWFSIGRGWALVRLGEEAEGIAMMRDNVAALRAIRAEIAFSEYLGMLVDGLLHAGRLQEALDVLAEAFDIVHCKHDRFYEAELTRLQGEILLAQRPAAADEAAMCFQQAIDIARRQQTKLFELRAAASFARLLAGSGQRLKARQVLSEVYDWFREGLDAADLRQASLLLADLAP